MQHIKKEEFKARRTRLMNMMDENSIMILWSAPEIVRTGDSHYTYRQNSYFYYLTGYQESNAVMVLLPGRSQGEFIFFNEPNNPEYETWVGKRIGQEGACQHYLANEAYPIQKLDEILPKLMEGKSRVYYDVGMTEHDEIVAKWVGELRRLVRKGGDWPHEFFDVLKLIDEQRLIKTVSEINLMRHIGQLSARAHVEAMKTCKNLKHEYQIEAVLRHYLGMNGCREWAYDPIIACGANANVLHYTANTAPLIPGELLLIDAGGEWGNYAADISRTFPVSGKFSSEQGQIYNLVLKAQKAAIEMIKPNVAWNMLQETIIQILVRGLVELGILRGSIDSLIEQEAYKPFYMHNSGHWIGLDTHDVGLYKINNQWQNLRPGMVLTIEPGLYIKPTDSVDSRWWNIGVRIEDDILVTDTGYEVLTSEVPKEITEIEAIMQG